MYHDRSRRRSDHVISALGRARSMNPGCLPARCGSNASRRKTSAPLPRADGSRTRSGRRPKAGCSHRVIVLHRRRGDRGPSRRQHGRRRPSCDPPPADDHTGTRRRQARAASGLGGGGERGEPSARLFASMRPSVPARAFSSDRARIPCARAQSVRLLGDHLRLSSSARLPSWPKGTVEHSTPSLSRSVAGPGGGVPRRRPHSTGPATAFLNETPLFNRNNRGAPWCSRATSSRTSIRSRDLGLRGIHAPRAAASQMLSK
jgi:hypothetical protein